MGFFTRLFGSGNSRGEKSKRSGALARRRIQFDGDFSEEAFEVAQEALLLDRKSEVGVVQDFVQRLHTSGKRMGFLILADGGKHAQIEFAERLVAKREVVLKSAFGPDLNYALASNLKLFTSPIAADHPDIFNLICSEKFRRGFCEESGAIPSTLGQALVDFFTFDRPHIVNIVLSIPSNQKSAGILQKHLTALCDARKELTNKSSNIFLFTYFLERCSDSDIRSHQNFGKPDGEIGRKIAHLHDDDMCVINNWSSVSIANYQSWHDDSVDRLNGLHIDTTAVRDMNTEVDEMFNKEPDRELGPVLNRVVNGLLRAKG